LYHNDKNGTCKPAFLLLVIWRQKSFILWTDHQVHVNWTEVSKSRRQKFPIVK
jgi:hypothetical protein